MKPPFTDSRTQPSLTLPRSWGFRFSLNDVIALIAFGAVAAVLHRLESQFSWLIVIAAGHFFLFCNVFRLLRRRELLWTALYLLNVGFWLLLGRLDWFNVLACQLPVSVGVISWEIKATRYHGIFADRWNPALNDYLKGKSQ